MKANAVVYNIRVSDCVLIPVLLTLDNPRVAVQILDDTKFSYMGVDSVAVVSAHRLGDSYQIMKIADVTLLDNGDSTTARKTIAQTVVDGRLSEFISRCSE